MGPDGLSRFDELRRREAAQTAILYAFDLIEHDGEDLRDRPFLDRKAALARLLRDTDAGILLNEAVAAPQRKSLGKGPWLSTMPSLITPWFVVFCRVNETCYTDTWRLARAHTSRHRPARNASRSSSTSKPAASIIARSAGWLG